MKKWIALLLALILTLMAVSAAVADVKLKTGDHVKFGNYGDEKIEWIVLDMDGDNLFLLSRYGLDVVPFNTRSDGSMWKDCELRFWLNDDFYHSAFSKEERKAIVETEVEDDADQNNSKWMTAGRVTSTKTKDKVYCLSYREVRDYLSSEEDRKCIPTSYCISRKSNLSNSKMLNGKKTCWWWLRSSAFKANAGVVDWDGSIETCYIHHPRGVVRPCLWVEASAVEK